MKGNKNGHWIALKLIEKNEKALRATVCEYRRLLAGKICSRLPVGLRNQKFIKKLMSFIF